jgi:hypothetical protein
MVTSSPPAARAQSMHAGVLILLGVLKDKAMHWAAGSMIFYATVVYLYYEQGALKTECVGGLFATIRPV